MSKEGKRCRNCGQVNLVNEIICIYCKKKDGLIDVESNKYLKNAFELKKGTYNESDNKIRFSLAKLSIVIGIIGILFALGMDTSTGSVYNVGLMDRRRTTLIIFSLFVLVGFISLQLNSKSDKHTSQSTDTDTDTRPCPYCAETIKVKAILCKHCGKDLAKNDV